MVDEQHVSGSAEGGVGSGGSGREQPSRVAAVPDDHSLRELLTESQHLGFLGPGPVDAHLRHAEGFVSVVGQPERLLDLGSGGGVPGLVVARALPRVDIVLLDAMERRCRFLERAVAELGMDDRVTVVCGRAEDLARREDLRGGFSMVVTRSFGAPAVTAECAVGFLRTGGRLVVSEPPGHDPERWPVQGLAELGLRPLERRSGDGWTMQVLQLDEPAHDRFPRRTGVPTKRPLF